MLFHVFQDDLDAQANIMGYATDHVVSAFKKARVRQAISQRELSARSGVPQAQISRFESGAVDIRLSSIVALARALDLEVELVPRNALPAVETIIRAGYQKEPSESGGNRDQQTHASLERDRGHRRVIPAGWQAACESAHAGKVVAHSRSPGGYQEVQRPPEDARTVERRSGRLRAACRIDRADPVRTGARAPGRREAAAGLFARTLVGGRRAT